MILEFSQICNIISASKAHWQKEYKMQVVSDVRSVIADEIVDCVRKIGMIAHQDSGRAEGILAKLRADVAQEWTQIGRYLSRKNFLGVHGVYKEVQVRIVYNVNFGEVGFQVEIYVSAKRLSSYQILVDKPGVPDRIIDKFACNHELSRSDLELDDIRSLLKELAGVE